MAKLKLTQQELAALDALIAELQNGNQTVEAEITGNAAFITAVARVAVQATKVAIKATPYVADVAAAATVLGAAAQDETSKQLDSLAKEGLSVEKLIELRKKFS